METISYVINNMCFKCDHPTSTLYSLWQEWGKINCKKSKIFLKVIDQLNDNWINKTENNCFSISFNINKDSIKYFQFRNISIKLKFSESLYIAITIIEICNLVSFGNQFS